MHKLSFSSALELIIKAPAAEAIEIAWALENRSRARLAIFCYSRAHLREKAFMIAPRCLHADLVAESTREVAEQLMMQAEQCKPRRANLFAMAAGRAT